MWCATMVRMELNIYKSDDAGRWECSAQVSTDRLGDDVIK